MDFPIHIDATSLGPPIVYLKGLQVEFSKLRYISVPEDSFNLSKQSKKGSEDQESIQSITTPDPGYHIMLHFIWVFTVCQSTHLGVSSIQ